ncbi:MAG: hypothetical protein PHC34_09865 [Candidatus Gastranaerophilales bacterium]|nr:hypothetical protein [Candidatus Gastranaerophilales bacterium]
MNKNNSHEKKRIKNCDICGRPISVDEFGFGVCDCGWANMKIAIEQPDAVFLPNFLTFNHAKQLFKEGKPLLPSFDEFLEVLQIYGEMEFTYKNKVYGIIRGDRIKFFCVGIENSARKYESYNEFKEKADINGQLLINIWSEVTNINYLQ